MYSLFHTTKSAARSLAYRRPIIPRYHPQISSLRFNSTLQTKRCPNCSQPLPSTLPACTKCWHISTINPDTRAHDILGVPYHPNPFLVDQSLLKNNFRRSQAACHPDTWASKGDNKRIAAENLSAEINNAYQTLLNPLSRIEYLLRTNFQPLEETDKVEDLEFLGEIMMAREEIQDAETAEDVEPVLEQNQERIGQTLKEISRLVEASEWAKAKECAIKLRYLEGIRKAAKEWPGGPA
ncbi:molecular chaperone [Marasmius crinis-equi]|uniref:Molecular chaperone n=1 Tax=Marasmius crinis-equi TaxID=585013 RepID=A0ABR3G1C8_9AGAR